MSIRFADSLRAYVVLLVFSMLMSGCSLFKPAPEIVDSDPGKQPLPAELVSAYNDGLSLLEDGEYLAAETHWQALAEQYGMFPGVMLNYALSLYRLEKYEDALTQVSAAQVVNAEFCPAFSVRALIERELGQFREAESSYLSAISCNPQNADARYNLGILYDLYLHDLPKALEQYTQVQSMQSESDERLSIWITDLERRASAEQVAGEGS